MPSPAQRDAKIPDPDPEIERKTFILPEGFEVNLWAGDPLLAKPIQMNWDHLGRLWVASSETYPQIEPGKKANDKILILEDTNNDGKADKTTVFADGLLIPTGVEPDAKGGAYVAASTELLHFSKSKPELEKADVRKIVLSGFGTEDTHHLLHTLRWGPDGKLYMNQSVYIHSHVETPFGPRRLNGGGIWQFDTKTNRLEVFARGFWNPWGLAFDRYGQLFATDGANGEGVVHVIPGASYPTGLNAAPRVLHGMNPGSPKHCGLEMISGRHFPDDWQGDMVTNDFRGHRVCRFKLSEDGSTFAGKEMQEVIKSNHPAFRPIDVKMGPDGALYIADWYNPIIQHGEVDFRDPRRDHTHGRIWRVTAKGRALVKKPELEGKTTKEIVKLLADPEMNTRTMAKQYIRTFVNSKVIQSLEKIEGWDGLEKDPLFWFEIAQLVDNPMPLLSEDRPILKKFASNPRAMEALAHLTAKMVHNQAIELPVLEAGAIVLKSFVSDLNPKVRLEGIRALADVKSPAAVEYALKALDHPMDKTLDYALWLTVRELEPIWLLAFVEGKIMLNNNPKHIAFALQAINNPQTLGVLNKMIESAKTSPEDAAALMKLAVELGGPAEHKAMLDRVMAGKLKDDAARVLLMAMVAVSERKSARNPSAETELVKGILDDRVPDERRILLLRLAGLWKLPNIENHVHNILAGGARRSPEFQRAAIQALADSGTPSALRELRFQINAVDHPATRGAVIKALAGIDEQAAAKMAVEELMGKQGPIHDPAELPGIVDAFVQRKTGPATLAAALKGTKIPPDAAKIGLRVVRASGKDHPQLLAAFNDAGGLAALKPDYSPGAVQKMVEEVLAKGDAARGEAVYRRKDLQCMVCHAINGVGGDIGPDMGSVGAAAQVDYLVESIWLPNKAVKEGFHSILVNTEDGKTVSGIPIRENKDELVLRNGEGKEVPIAIKNIAERSPGKSLMPEALAEQLTRDELADLVKFLSQLGKDGPYAALKTKTVRRWQALDATPENTNYVRRNRLTAVAEAGAPVSWSPVYATVNGKLDPALIPSFAVWGGSESQSALRTQVESSNAGKAMLKVPNPAGLDFLLNGKPIDLKSPVDLKQGVNELVVIVNRGVRKDSIEMEWSDVADGAKFKLVLGK